MASSGDAKLFARVRIVCVLFLERMHQEACPYRFSLLINDDIRPQLLYLYYHCGFVLSIPSLARTYLLCYVSLAVEHMKTKELIIYSGKSR